MKIYIYKTKNLRSDLNDRIIRLRFKQECDHPNLIYVGEEPA